MKHFNKAILGMALVSSFAMADTAYAGSAADAHKPGKDLHDVYEYTKEVHSYAHGNSYYIKVLNQKKVGKTEFYADQKRQDDAVQSLNEQATEIHNTINNHGDVLSNHQQQIDQLSSTMGSQIQSAMTEARQARKEAKEAKAAAAVALAVAGQQFNTQGGFQTAISASTIGGNQALAVGAGGALNEKVFINAAIATSSNQTGGVVSATYAW